MTNYGQLKAEEKEIINTFKSYLWDTITFFETTFNNIITKNNAEELFDDSIEKDKKLINQGRDILDDCIWFIQKNEPRANHLRLIIAIINSLNDVKRISNYTVTLTKFYNKCFEEMDKITYNVIGSMGKNTIDTIKKLYQLVDKFDIEQMKQASKQIFQDHIQAYKANFYESVRNFLQSKEKPKYVANAVIVLKNFDRTVDHCMNIVDNLVTVL